MSSRTLAILIPANPFQYPTDSEERDRSDIDAHINHEREQGCVYWNVPGSGRKHEWLDDIKTAYFCYWKSRREKRVSYKADVLSAMHFMTKDEMRANFPVEETKCLYGTRRRVWMRVDEGGYDWETHWEKPMKWGFIFVKLRNIRRIRDHVLANFTRALGKSRNSVEICRKYVIVFDEIFE